MIEFLKAHQLNIMLFLSGICAILTILTLLTRTLSPKRKRILASLEFAAMMLLVADRFAYIYRGDPSELGFWMVRICNFLVYFITLFIPHTITLYLFDLFRNEGKMEKLPRRMYAAEVLYAIGVVLLIIAQFTGLYYTFDENNLYQRAPGNIICYIVPLLITFIQLSLLIQYHRKLRRLIVFALVLNTVVPIIASIIQLFAYGISLINMSVVGMAIFLYVFALIDLNLELEESRQELVQSTVTDDLTGISNMRKFDEDAKAYALNSEEKGKTPLYLVFNIVNFQTFNDHMGYAAGDELLKEMGQIMVSEFEDEPTARESGDRFAALTSDEDYLQHIANVRNRLLTLHSTESYLDLKVGAYRLNEHTRNSRHAIDRATYALKKIHNDDDTIVNEYTEKMSNEYRLRQFILNNLDRAIEDENIRVFYQPVMWAENETLAGFEALVRWIDPKRGLLSPAAFIPALESSRRIHLLDLCVYEQVCRQIRECLDQGLPVLPVSLNFSRLDFELMDPVAELDRLTEQYNIPKNFLHVEITESAATENVEELKKAMQRLHASGYAIWLDDFGSGYSSLNVLKDFDIDLLKIDMEFLRNFSGNGNSRNIISSIIALAEKLNMQTLCEGVETQEAVDFLREAGCGRLQGFYYGKPMPYKEILEKIENREFLLPDTCSSPVHLK